MFFWVNLIECEVSSHRNAVQKCIKMSASRDRRRSYGSRGADAKFVSHSDGIGGFMTKVDRR
jgi:hypothetical protein